MFGVAAGLRLSGISASSDLAYGQTQLRGTVRESDAASSLHESNAELNVALHLCRFSHASALVSDQVVITHGFFYDVEARAAQWLSDTWSMAVRSPYTWRRLHSGCSILLQLLYSTADAQ